MILTPSDLYESGRIFPTARLDIVEEELRSEKLSLSYRLSKEENRIAYQPQRGPQRACSMCPASEIFFGGARGGGKTYTLLGMFLVHRIRATRAGSGGYCRGIIFRKTYDELTEVISQAQVMYPKVGGVYKAVPREFHFPNGDLIRFRYLQRDQDAQRYQGHQYTFIGVDEIANFPTSTPIDKLYACLRSPHGVPTLFMATGNPGMPGHNWVKSRYIDVAKPGKIFKNKRTGESCCFIPSKLLDNKILMSNDPGYENRLRAVGADWLVDAWLQGNWDIVAGGALDDIWDRDVHVLSPFDIPFSWEITRSFDWGSSKPFSVGWWAQSDGTEAPNGIIYPAGTLFRIQEYYGWNGTPNTGVRSDAKEIAVDILKLEEEWGWDKRVQGGVADRSIFIEENGNCIARDFSDKGVTWSSANQAPGSRHVRLEKIRERLKASLNAPLLEEPGLFVFDHCTQFIRTVPVLPRNEKDLDDVDTNAEDHIYDETGYRIMFDGVGSVGEIEIHGA